MPKTRDIPQNMRDFNKVFEKLSYRHDYSVVFTDFLESAIKGFSLSGDFEEFDKYLIGRYSKDERLLFGQLIIEWVKVMDKEITGDKDWYDAFGAYYEVLASNGKKSAFGQFFTPDCICNFTAMCLSDENTIGKLINEPSCGSGRFIISFHVHNLGNYYFAEDLDLVCCKMTVLNMLMHGCVGVVINHNSLSQGDFRQAWVVNETLNLTGVPTIRKISIEEVDLFYLRWKPWDNEIIQKVEQSELVEVGPVETPQPQEILFEKVEQLSLF